MGGLGVKVQHFPLTLLVVLTTLTLPCERDIIYAGRHTTKGKIIITNNKKKQLTLIVVIIYHKELKRIK